VVSELKGEVEMLFDEDNRCPLLLVDVRQCRTNSVDLAWLYAFGYLVRENQPRVGEECPRDKEHLLLSSAERPGSLLIPLAQEREMAQCAIAGTIELAAIGKGNVQIFLDRQIREESGFLWNVSNAETRDLIGSQAAGALSIEVNLAPKRL
jgi:hypothetical protein